jgi:hypothetical protein
VKRLPRALVWGGVAAGLLVRVWALRSPLGRYNSDDAVVGLMALRINAGEHFLFYWGQDYGGAFEPELTALVFRVVGAGSVALRVVPVSLHAVSALLLARVGTRLLDAGRGELAGLLWWVAPPVGVLWSIHAGGYYGALVAIGLGIALLTLRLRERVERRDAIGPDAIGPDAIGPDAMWPDAMGLGVLLGLGLWASPQIAILAVIPVVALAARLRRATWRLLAWIVVPAAVVLVPWLRHQFDHGFVSLRPPAAVLPLGYLDRVEVWWRATPTMLGFQHPYRTAFIAPGAAVLFAAVAVAIVVAIGRLRPPPWFVIAWALAVPFWFAASPFATSAFVIRYLYPGLPIVALAVAATVRRTAIGAGVLVLAAGVTAATVVATAEYADDHRRFSYEIAPPPLGLLVEHLERVGVEHVWADYFVAYRLTLATEERIVAAPTDASRYAPYERAVRAARARTYVVAACDAPFARERFEQRGLGYDEQTVGDFAVFTLAEARTPGEVGFHLGILRPYRC